MADAPRRDRWQWRLIHNAITDPAQHVQRGTHTDGDPDELHVWQADAVLSALIDAAEIKDTRTAAGEDGTDG